MMTELPGFSVIISIGALAIKSDSALCSCLEIFFSGRLYVSTVSLFCIMLLACDKSASPSQPGF